MQHRTDPRGSIRRNQVAGLIAFAFLAGGVGSWAATVDISGAVIAPGLLVVDTNVKKVQHPTGGIVGEIRVRDGDRVEAGDVVVRLDDTITRANLAIVTKGLTELTARKARLEAERDGADAIIFPAELTERSSDERVAHVIAGEQRLFDLRQTARVGQKQQLRQRIAQIKQEIRGQKAQSKAKAEEIELVEQELKGARMLFERNLYPITKMTNLRRAATRVRGEKGSLISAIARSKARIAETELEIIQIDRDLASEVARELREIDAKIGEFVERKVTAEDELKRMDLRAPQAGTVHQSTAHTVGGVINSGEEIMLIVPKADNLAVEVKVAPQDIDQLSFGQTALLRFSAFNQRTTPEISGAISRISADITTEERTGQSYYTVRIAMADEEISRLGKVALQPGMPVEAFIKTGDRKVISYLVKPLNDQITRAFREQ
jgi:HlyD family secretion protein